MGDNKYTTRMINFLKKDNRLILCYIPEYAGSVNWITDTIKAKGLVKLKKTFRYTEGEPGRRIFF